MHAVDIFTHYSVQWQILQRQDRVTGIYRINFMPKYRKVRTSNDKHVPEFMRMAYPDYAQRDQENLCAMGIRGLFAFRRVQYKFENHAKS